MHMQKKRGTDKNHKTQKKKKKKILNMCRQDIKNQHTY